LRTQKKRQEPGEGAWRVPVPDRSLPFAPLSGTGRLVGSGRRTRPLPEGSLAAVQFATPDLGRLSALEEAGVSNSLIDT